MKTFPQSNRRSKRHLTADVHGLAFGLWLDASCGVFLDVAGTVPANNGDPVACWRSRHDPSVKATQATLAKRPMYQLLNGVPRVVFDGVDDGLVLSDWRNRAVCDTATRNVSRGCTRMVSIVPMVTS